jgi:WD40 repeat protein
VVPEARRLVGEQPTRERRWSLLALAEYRTGRQADALGTIQRARATLVRDLGLDPGPDLAALEQAILRQDPSLAGHPALEPSTVCPYPGLLVYDVDDAAAFFGREADVAACLERLGASGVLAVVGPSGCGKSSLARAGIAAALARDGHQVVVLAPGRHPVATLADAAPPASAVLVVDQCEQVFVGPGDERERSTFFELLLAHAARAPLVITLRADRMGEFAAHPAFARRVEQGLYLLSAMPEPALRRAILGPAEQAGLRLEPGLVDLLVREVEGEPGALPLLSHALRETWGRREGTTLTVESYQRSGGIRESVAQSAEEVVGSLTPGEQASLRDLMVRLVVLNDDGAPVRTRLPRRNLPTGARHAELVERLVAARLVSAHDNGLEVAHEALIRAWPRLRSWLDEDVEGLRTMRHLSVAAESWAVMGRPESELYRGVRQARAQEWHRRTHPGLTETERAFLDASTALSAREERAAEEHLRLERRSNQRLRTGLAAVAVLLAVAVITSAAAFAQAGRAQAQAQAADGRRLGAEALRTDAIDSALLLAVGGQRLHDSVDTRSTVLATLDRVPSLITTTRLGSPATSLAVSPTTGVVAAALPGGNDSADAGLSLHDGSTLTRTRLVTAVRGPAVVALPDGRWVASVMPEDTGTAERPALRLLEADGTAATRGLGGVPARGFVQQQVAASPGGRWLVAVILGAAGAPGALTGVWDLRTPERPVALLDLGDQDVAPVLSADGGTLYTVREGRLTLTAVPSGHTQRTMSARDLRLVSLGGGLALSPDGRRLAVSGGSQTALVDTATMTPTAVLETGPSSGTASFSTDGRRLAVVGDELTVWETAGDTETPRLRQRNAGGWAAFAPDGATIHTLDFEGLIRSWDLAGDRQVVSGRRIAPPSSGGIARFSPDHRRVVLVSGAGVGRAPTTVVHDLANGTTLDVDPGVVGHGFTLDVAWDPGSRRVAVTTGDPEVVVSDAVDGIVEARRPLGAGRADGTPDTATFAWWTPDGGTLLVGSGSGRLHLLDPITLHARRPPIQVTQPVGDDPPQPLYGLTVSPDGRYAAAGPHLVDLTTGSTTNPEVLDGALAVAWSPDGSRALVTGEDGSIGLVDTRTWAWRSPRTTAHPFRAWRVAWSSDGALVATTGGGRVGHWDGHTGEFLGSTVIDTEADAVFTPDRRALEMVSDDGRLLTWRLGVDAWVAAACRLAGREMTREEWHSYLGDRRYSPVCSTASSAS